VKRHQIEREDLNGREGAQEYQEKDARKGGKHRQVPCQRLFGKQIKRSCCPEGRTPTEGDEGKREAARGTNIVRRFRIAWKYHGGG